MALFKVNRGIENNLPSAKTDGYVYFCKDSGHIYFDYIGDDGKLRRQEVTASIADKIKGIAVDGQYIEITAAEIKACIDKLDQEDLNIKNGSGAGSLRMNNTTAVTESDDGGQEYRPQTPETPTPQADGADAFAVGSGTRADGDASTAEGVLTVAGYVRANKTRSVGAHAEGEGTYAKSSASHAEGYHTQALASNAHTEGFFTKVNADGWSGHAEGRETVVNGRAGHAEGYLTQANGTEAHAEGMSTVASGDHSHAEGMSSVASGLGAHAEGATTTAGVGNKAIAKGAHAEGVGTTASGEDSHAEGAKTTASGLHSHAEGFSTNAIGNVSHAEGDRTTADGSAGHAEGCLTTAKYRSHAEGEKTVAGGGTTGTRGAHAEGVETQALAFASHAGGVGSVVDNYASTAIGSYPMKIAGTPTKYNKNAVAFAVGNGTGDTARSNAFEVSFDGTGKLGGKSILTDADKNASYIVDIGVEDKYFDIDINGMVCLKPAYRGALPTKRSAYTYAISDAGIGVVGTKNSELPERVVIPDMVKGLPVKSMAVGMFCNNMVVKEIVLPAAVTAIPDAWCRESCVEKVLNTQNITSIGGFCFQKSRLLYANFPNLQTILEKAAFYICNNLRFANIGNVTAIPSRCFAQCGSLTEVKSNQAVTSIGDYAFATTESLRKVSFLPPTDKMQSVGERAFFSTGLDFTNTQWNSFSDSFGTEATPAQIHQDIWSECTVTPHLNGLPTAFGQTDPRWKDLPIYTGTNNYGETQKTYYYGCVFFAIITAYCGLHNLSFDTVQDLATYLDEHHSGWRPLFSSNGDHIAPFITHLGMTCEQLPFPDASLTDTMAQKTAKLQHLYDQISSGKYITFTVRGGESMYDGHAVVAFGLTEDKRFVISNSAGSLTPNMYDSTQYALPYQNLCIRNPSKPETLNTIIVLGLAEGGEDA